MTSHLRPGHWRTDTEPRRLWGLGPLATTLAFSAWALGACSKPGPPTFQGYVEGEFVHVGSGVAGRLDRLLVARGQSVAKDAPLYELESGQEAAAVRQADQSLSAASAQLADLKTGKRSAEIDVVRAQLEQAKAAERQSASQLAHDTAGVEAGGVSRLQLEASRAKHDADVARVRELERQQDVAEMAARPEQIRAGASDVAAARAAADQTRWRLDQKRVAASQAGLVVDTLFREGEWVPAGSPVVRMLPAANLKVRFFVPQPSLALLPIGRQLTIRCDGCAAEIGATVSYVATEPEYTPPIIYSNENRAKLVFMIEARPAGEGGSALHPGQPVEVLAP
jgi:HlyD family secretion protein